MATTSPIYLLPAPQLGDVANIETAIVPLRNRLEVLLAEIASVPLGTQLSYAGSALPTSLGGVVWAWADGALVSRTTYSAFFAAVGHSYNGGVDPGSTMVRLPDKRGRVMMGADSMGTAGAAGRLPNTTAKARGQNGGVERHALTAAEMPSHDHQLFTANDLSGGGGYHVLSSQRGQNWQTVGDVTPAGGGGAHNNLQPYEVDLVIVRIR